MFRFRLLWLRVACQLCCWAICSSQSTVKSGYELGLAIVDQTVSRIAVPQTVDLAEFQHVLRAMTATGPFTISRDVELYNPGSGDVDVNMAYLTGLMKLQAGVTVTFTSLRVTHIEVQMFSNSPDAAVVLQRNAELHPQFTVPNAFKQAFFANAARPNKFPGTQQFSIDDTTGTVHFTDEAFTVPLANNKGGFDMHFINSYLASDATTNLPVECDGPGSGLPGLPSATCIAAVQRAVKEQLCALPDCVYTCRDGCASQCSVPV